MESRLIYLLLLLLFFLPLGWNWWNPTLVAAQQESPTHHSIDVVIVLDESGSIGTCWPWKADETTHYSDTCEDRGYPNEPNDPDNLRYSAARLLVHLADEDDRLAVLRFGEVVAPVGQGTLQRVGTTQERSELVQSIQPPENYDHGGYTRIDLALQEAVTVLTERDQSEQRPGYVLFLTDGDPTQPYDLETQHESVKETMQQARIAHIKVFPVVLGDRCPEDFLTELVAPPARAHQADELLEVFSTIFAQMKPNMHIAVLADLYTNPVCFPLLESNNNCTHLHLS